MSKFIDLINTKFERLTVVKRIDPPEHVKNKNHIYWLCKCDCGNETIAIGYNLKSGKIKSCGCLKKQNNADKFIDLTGRIFGELNVLNKTDMRWSNSIVWKCKCSCGNIHYSTSRDLGQGRTNSCGCKKGELISKSKGEKRKWFYDAGTNIIDEKRNLTITDRYFDFNVSQKKYKTTCNICKWDNNIMMEHQLKKGYGCACCKGITVVEGINDIPTRAPWMVKFFQGGYDEAKMYTPWSDKRIFPVCPTCNTVKTNSIIVGGIYANKTFKCNCSDGISYPEKFMNSMLQQLSISFEWGYKPDWLIGKNGNQREFDFRVDNIIIEMDGNLGHGKRIYNNSKLTIRETLEIDNWKDKQAGINGYNVYRINSDKSEMVYLKNQIINTIGHLFNLSQINWLKCDESGLKNMTKYICEYYMNNKNLSLIDMGKIFSLHHSTIRSYFRKGTLHGWCDYDTKIETLKRSQIVSKIKTIKLGKPVAIYKDGIKLKEYISATELERNGENDFGVKFYSSNIRKVLNNERKHSHGYTFQYIDNIEGGGLNK